MNPKFSVISSRRQPSGRRDGFRLTPLRMCSCGMGLARACLLVLPWSVCLGRPAESRARPERAHSAAETAIPVALVVDFRALQVASNGLGASARSWCLRHRASSNLHIPSGSYPMRAYVTARRSARIRIEDIPDLAALLEDHANVEPRIPMARARARARGAAGRFWPN
jgi:hypothetical protein